MVKHLLNPIIVLNENLLLFHIWYYHDGLGWRPDVKVVTLGLLPFAWYRHNLEYVYPGLSVETLPQQVDDAWMLRLSQQNGLAPVCRSWPVGDQIQHQCTVYK